jgi:hypothetical protein
LRHALSEKSYTATPVYKAVFEWKSSVNECAGGPYDMKLMTET